jgi:hypothetical protein
MLKDSFILVSKLLISVIFIGIVAYISVTASSGILGIIGLESPTVGILIALLIAAAMSSAALTGIDRSYLK